MCDLWFQDINDDDLGLCPFYLCECTLMSFKSLSVMPLENPLYVLKYGRLGAQKILSFNECFKSIVSKEYLINFKQSNDICTCNKYTDTSKNNNHGFGFGTYIDIKACFYIQI